MQQEPLMLNLLKKIFRLNPVTLTVILIALGILLYLIEIPFLELVELKTVDLRFAGRKNVSQNSKVVLAVIDEKSVDREGKWVWPRSKIADLVTKLSDAGAEVIALDLVMSEPDEKSVVSTIAGIERNLTNLDADNKAYLEKLKKSSDNDRLLADAILGSKAKVVLGYFFQMEKEHSGDEDEALAREEAHSIRSSRYGITRYLSGSAMQAPLFKAMVANGNIPSIASTTEYSGYFNMFPDIDGVVRWIPAVISYRDETYAPLSLMTVSALLGERPRLMVADYGVEKVEIGPYAIPTDELGRIMINYRGDAKTFRHISITDILNGEVPADVFSGKIVMVGATAVGIYDMRVTPFSSVFPGVEIHANIVDSVLSRDFLFQPAWAGVFDIAVIVLAGAILGFVLPRVSVFPGIATAGLLFFGHMYFCRYIFNARGWILNMVYPLMVILAVYIGITAYKYLVESRQKRFIRNAFSTYLAPTVVKKLIDSPETLELGGEERDITAFFSDVQGFTSISEKLTPAELVELLNEFLTEMTDIILQHEGTVDKFEGDAIIAFFGAPNELGNQAETAAITCVHMQKRLHELRLKWKSEGRPELKMRIGLCTGPAVVGNMGSRNRMDYTMMGDTVNTAARLEGVNKVYGIYSLVCEQTFKRAGDRVVGREIDAINVVGKKEPVVVYQLLGFPEETDEKIRGTIQHYAAGLQNYRQMRWDDALACFQAALEISPDDGPSMTMAGRCREYRQNPPAAGWNGSYTMKTK
ncbi:MAG: adenylate/guanylate cyclase domain-containing protein [Deltaproteobacteria bacterium]|nr:adenylate/guanylate cyclase domain-containing protein [Deltaproteobacteria bacterium]